jgi:hypothetical protein
LGDQGGYNHSNEAPDINRKIGKTQEALELLSDAINQDKHNPQVKTCDSYFMLLISLSISAAVSAGSHYVIICEWI